MPAVHVELPLNERAPLVVWGGGPSARFYRECSLRSGGTPACAATLADLPKACFTDHTSPSVLIAADGVLLMELLDRLPREMPRKLRVLIDVPTLIQTPDSAWTTLLAAMDIELLAAEFADHDWWSAQAAIASGEAAPPWHVELVTNGAGRPGTTIWQSTLPQLVCGAVGLLPAEIVRVVSTGTDDVAQVWLACADGSTASLLVNGRAHHERLGRWLISSRHLTWTGGARFEELPDGEIAEYPPAIVERGGKDLSSLSVWSEFIDRPHRLRGEALPALAACLRQVQAAAPPPK